MVRIITKRFKRKKVVKKSKNMVKRRKSSRRRRASSTVRRVARRMAPRRKSRGRRSSVGGGGLFSGKILGMNIPFVSKVVKNKTLQKAMVGAGTVAVIGGLVGLANQPALSNFWNRTPVRVGAAIATGDIVGGATVLALENPNILGGIRGQVGQVAGQQMAVQQAGFA